MAKDEAFISALTARFGSETTIARRRCSPRILILVDGLDYTTAGFGLSRFLYAITLGPGVPVKPTLTLAHRFTHPTPTVTIGTDTYTVVNDFDFFTAATPVTLANYDQIWIFGINGNVFQLSADEVNVISLFMNGGGGFFATGDHASLGRELCGDLPRIRHMREWRDQFSGGVPMGAETDVALAVMRIDTISDPGANNLYEFSDQSDNVPQRIWPNYRVTDTDGGAGSAWSATVHPVLMLAGAPTTRTTNTDFQNDLDVLPDHPHESVCIDVTDGTVLSGNYDLYDQDFREFPPSAPDAKPIRPEVVAWAVSGGRSLEFGIKPPVRPRMFPVISAWDGRVAMPYGANTQPPGRVVCESTWHHYVNINIDGTGSPHTGLGTGTGAGFTAGPALLKIYNYWNNTVTWLQPANRIWCRIFWELAEARFDAAVYEELMAVDELTGWRDLVALGRQGRAVLSSRRGRGMLRDALVGLLVTDAGFAPVRAALLGADAVAAPVDSPVMAEALDEAGSGPDAFGREELLDGVFGSLLAETARLLPDRGNPAATAEAIAAGPGAYVERLREAIARAIKLCAEDQGGRLARGRAIAESLHAIH